MESPDKEDYQRIEALWTEEAERRDREIDDGIVKAIPGEEVLQRLQSRYKRKLTTDTAVE